MLFLSYGSILLGLPGWQVGTGRWKLGQWETISTAPLAGTSAGPYLPVAGMGDTHHSVCVDNRKSWIWEQLAFLSQKVMSRLSGAGDQAASVAGMLRP